MSKAIVLIASLMVFSGATWASNARKIALGNPAHYCDVQNVVVDPSVLYCLGDQIQFEFGETAKTTKQAETEKNTVPNNEGTLIQSFAGGKLGFSVGRHSEDINNVRNTLNLAFLDLTADKPFLPTENSLSLVYATKAGELVWGLGLYMSSSDIKSTKQKQSTQIVTLGLDAPVWYFNARLPLTYDATGFYSTTSSLVELKSKPGMTMTGGYKLTPSQRVFVDVTGGAGKLSVAGTEMLDLTIAKTTLGFSNQFFNKEGTNAYYQLAYEMEKKTQKATTTTETTVTKLPFLMGIETEATPWMVIRGSVSQSVLINSKKTDSADADTTEHDTKVGAGTGFKWGKSLLDLTLNAATSGAFGSDTNFGGNASYTYAF